ncbi:MAG: hypothetical protein GY870_02230 [archaeon]|nr:hypothetical protein [archaeon]
MNKFVVERKNLLNIFTEATKSEKKEVEPILNKAINNFEREMKMPIENFVGESPKEMETQVFNVLIKHFVCSMLNEKVFMEEKNIKEITQRIENLIE